MFKAFSALLSSSLLAAGVAFASSLAATPAQAFSLSIDPQYGSTENTGSTAKLDFNFIQQGANVLLNLGIANTTNGSTGLGATQSTLVGVGFDLPSIISSYTYNPGSSAFTQLYNDASLPPYGSFDVGIRSAGSGNFAGGNPQQGLSAGQSTLVSFLLSGSNLVAANVESGFLSGFQSGALSAVGRFQQVNAGGGSDKVLAGVAVGEGGGVTSVPEPDAEPATLVSLALVAAGVVVSRRRKVNLSA